MPKWNDTWQSKLLVRETELFECDWTWLKLKKRDSRGKVDKTVKLQIQMMKRKRYRICNQHEYLPSRYPLSERFKNKLRAVLSKSVEIWMQKWSNRLKDFSTRKGRTGQTSLAGKCWWESNASQALFPSVLSVNALPLFHSFPAVSEIWYKYGILFLTWFCWFSNMACSRLLLTSQLMMTCYILASGSLFFGFLFFPKAVNAYKSLLVFYIGI